MLLYLSFALRGLVIGLLFFSFRKIHYIEKEKKKFMNLYLSNKAVLEWVIDNKELTKEDAENIKKIINNFSITNNNNGE